MWPKGQFVGLAAFLLMSGFSLAEEAAGDVRVTTDAISVDLQAATPEGNSELMQVEPISVDADGKSLDAIEVEFRHGKGVWPALVIPAQVVGEGINTLVFRANFKKVAPARRNFGVMLLDSHGNTDLAGFAKFARDLGGGWHEFSWNYVDQPQLGTSLATSDIQKVWIRYNFEDIPEGEADKIILADMHFIAGAKASAGDPKLYRVWREYADAYKPDYSDSTKDLSPPTSGRIASPLALTRNGKPLGEIVLAADASETEKTAAHELRHWIGEITGAMLPIVQTPSGEDNVKIVLGKKFASGKYGDDLKKLEGSDGFAVRTKGKNIHIFGDIPKGTMNGVFAFIENNTDLIWARPNPEYGVIFSKNGNLNIVWADALSRPAAQLRGWLPNLGGEDDFWNWSDRNRNNYVTGDAVRNQKWGDVSEFGGGHNLQSFIPKNDRRYYPTIGGKKPDEISIWKHQICMSVPNLEETYAENVLRYIQEKSPAGIDTFNIKIEDNWGVCECEKCTAPITLADGRVLTVDDPAFRSTQFYRFLNKVTSIVNKTLPDLKIQTYAYFFTATPPKETLNPNIKILFCPYVRKDHRTPLCSPINDHWWKTLTAWSKMTPNVVIREYYGVFNEGRPLAEVVAADVRNDLALGVNKFGAEINPDFVRLWSDGEIRGGGDEFDVNMMDYWVINRLYWNPNDDVEHLRKYFIRRTFREAAPEMERFFGAIRENWYQNKAISTWGERQVYNPALLGEEKVDEMRAHLSAAAKLAVHPVSKTLIERITQRFEQYLVKNK